MPTARSALFLSATLACGVAHAAEPVIVPLQATVGEAAPSDDPQIKDFHSLGLIDGRTDIFRSASPVRDLGLSAAAASADRAAADGRMRHLHDLGVRTIVCLEDPNESESKRDKADALVRRLQIERDAGAAAGITFESFPMRNSGPDSVQTETDAQLKAKLDAAEKLILTDAERGGVLFHCSAGHDRTGIVAAWIRIDHQHWRVESAIAEMRRMGHNWIKMSDDGGAVSWHEAHLRSLTATATTRP